MGKKLWLAMVTAIAAVLMGVGLTGCYQQAPTARVAESTVPSTPSDLAASAVTQNSIRLQWVDRSDDEDGFRIYRDGMLVGTVSMNVVVYQDKDLKPATTYQYVVRAYNQVGESEGSSYTAKTLNPPITVKLNRIGVYDNGESGFRDFDGGEVYVYVVITDGNTAVKQRFPSQEGKYLFLEDNETVEIGETIFSTNEVGDSLTIAFVGYERDGGVFEQLVYKALGAAMESQIAGGTGSMLEAFEFSLGGLMAELFGAEDDWLGSYEKGWGIDDYWGVGKYTDIACEEEDGTLGLRLWFTIESGVTHGKPEISSGNTGYREALPENPTNEQLYLMVYERLGSLAKTPEAREYVSIFLTQPWFHADANPDDESWVVGICPGEGAQATLGSAEWFRFTDSDLFFDTHWGEPKAAWKVYRDGRTVPVGKGVLVEEDIARLNMDNELK